MRLVTIRSEKLKMFLKDPEMPRKAKRPCVLIVNLVHKGSRRSFAVPIRSNINSSTPKELYFPLPPRRSTRDKCRHGIHYAKMFPVDRSCLLRYRTEGNEEASRMESERTEVQLFQNANGICRIMKLVSDLSFLLI